jgi:hypothetical protein
VLKLDPFQRQGDLSPGTTWTLRRPAAGAVQRHHRNPAGASNKYELDKRTGLLKLDRVLHSAMHYFSHKSHPS